MSRWMLGLRSRVSCALGGSRSAVYCMLPMAAGLISRRCLGGLQGSGIMTRAFKGFEPYKGDLDGIRKGVLVSMKSGTSTLYSLDKLQARGLLFIHPGEGVRLDRLSPRSRLSQSALPIAQMQVPCMWVPSSLLRTQARLRQPASCRRSIPEHPHARVRDSQNLILRVRAHNSL